MTGDLQIPKARGRDLRVQVGCQRNAGLPGLQGGPSSGSEPFAHPDLGQHLEPDFW